MRNSKLIFLGSILFMSLILISCRKTGLCKDEKLNLVRSNYDRNNLKINGFYYGNPDTAWNKIIRFTTIVFYRNGILNLPGSTEFDKMESYIESVAQSNMLNKTKYIWGLYQIQDSLIILEYWEPAQCGYPMIKNYGKVLNDSTFCITRVEKIKENYTESIEIKQEFNFRKFAVKPDSIQSFL
jgi:hypothetical protein